LGGGGASWGQTASGKGGPNQSFGGQVGGFWVFLGEPRGTEILFCQEGPTVPGKKGTLQRGTRGDENTPGPRRQKIFRKKVHERGAAKKVEKVRFENETNDRWERRENALKKEDRAIWKSWGNLPQYFRKWICPGGTGLGKVAGGAKLRGRKMLKTRKRDHRTSGKKKKSHGGGK